MTNETLADAADVVQHVHAAQGGSAFRSVYGGSVRGDDDTCSLPTTTWSGYQARTPIAVRRLGPLPPAPVPHHQPPAKPRAWLARIVKLAALGAVVAITATGVIKVCTAGHPYCLNVCFLHLLVPTVGEQAQQCKLQKLYVSR